MTEIDLTPITRLEYDIDAILNDHAVAEPITRIELILADIVAGNTTTVVPVTRIETYLAIISGADYPVPEPVTRIETFLAIIAGEDYETPEAVTRLEGLLAEWVEKGSGIWKTVTGALIHITDALASPMQKCEVTLEPIQDLHGQDAPYPAGGGKNLLNLVRTVGTPNPSGSPPANPRLMSVDNYYVGITRNNYYDTRYITSYNITDTEVKVTINSGGYGIGFPVAVLPETIYTVSFVNGGNGKVAFGFFDAEWNFLTHLDNLATTCTFTTPQSCGYVVVVITGVSFNIEAIVSNIQLELGSTATSFAPYENICPITGRTGANAYVTGVNVWDEEWEIGGITNGVNSYSNIRLRSKNYIPCKGGATYFGVFDNVYTGGSWYVVWCYDKDKTYIGDVAPDKNKAFTTLENASFFRFSTSDGWNGAEYTGGISFNYPSTDTDYHAYSGTTLSVTFPDGQTVYGGTVDLVSGLLTVDRAIKTLDGTNIYSATDYGSNYRGTFDVIGIEKAAGTNYNSINEKMKASNCFVNSSPHSASSATKFSISYMGYNSERVLVVAIGISSYADFATYMNNNPIQLVYPLAEPIEIQLTPQQISTLKGENNVWSNTNGDTTIIYKAQA